MHIPSSAFGKAIPAGDGVYQWLGIRLANSELGHSGTLSPPFPSPPLPPFLPRGPHP